MDFLEYKNEVLQISLLGGPGSNKGNLIQNVLRRVPGWAHISMGNLLRSAVDSRDFTIEEAQKLRDTIAAGEMVDKV